MTIFSSTRAGTAGAGAMAASAGPGRNGSGGQPARGRDADSVEPAGPPDPQLHEGMMTLGSGFFRGCLRKFRTRAMNGPERTFRPV